MVPCPVCSKDVSLNFINQHLDSGCTYPKTESSATSGPQIPKPMTYFPDPTAARLTAATPSEKQNAIISPGNPKRVATSSYSYNKKNIGAEEGEEEDEDEHVLKKPRAYKKPSHLEKAMPLAEKMRPKNLDDIRGQELVGRRGVLRGLIEEGKVPSMILWGAAGCGKTTIARVIATMSSSRFIEISATASGVNDCKKIFVEAKSELVLTGRRTILFCDEIHRYTKTQQDVFLAPVEKGEIVLIGATTENPSFKVQSALLSRCRTFTLNKLSQADIETILHRALLSESSLDRNGGHPIVSQLLDASMIEYLARFADGDARTGLNLLELALGLTTSPGITQEQIKKSLAHTIIYDRAGDAHYDTISAFHKSVRGSDPDGTIFWLARMLKGGEDPLFIARRMIVMASEDIGLADNSMLSLATATFTAIQQVGMPEARINLAHCAVALALSKKSTRSYRALGKAMELCEHDPALAGAPVPVHLRNAPTKLMKELGYGKEYKYNPDYRNGKVEQEYLPEQLEGTVFLEDIDLGTKVDPDLRDNN